MSEMGMENTTQQLRYRGEDPTTQGQPTMPPPPATELVSGRVPVARPFPPAAESLPEPAAAPARPPESGRGLTTIAQDVVERVIQKVVDLTVAEVAGVHGLRPGVDAFFVVDGADPKAAGGAARGAADGPDRAVAVTLVEDRATVNLSIEVEFGYAVHEVVEQVRAGVIGSAERLLGITITEVNVVVADVAFDAVPAGPEGA